MKKKLPPHNEGNVRGRKYEDRMTAICLVRDKHEYKGPWKDAPQPLKDAARRLAKKLYEKRKETIESWKKPEGPISFFNFATGKPMLE